MYTVVKKEEDLRALIKWNRPYNKKTKELGPVPHKPIEIVLHKTSYTDINGNMISKGYEENKANIQRQIDEALSGLEERLQNSYGVQALESFNTKYSTVVINENFEYVGSRTGKPRAFDK